MGILLYGMFLGRLKHSKNSMIRLFSVWRSHP